jgi:hypothetical protein
MINEEQVRKFLEGVMAKLSHQLSGWTKDLLNMKEECFFIWIGCVFVTENKEYAQFT